MSVTQPQSRIRFAKKEVDRYQEDVEEWNRQHNELPERCWVWEDLVGKAIYLFDWLMVLDCDVRECLFRGEITPEDEGALTKEMEAVLREWLGVSLRLLTQVERSERECGKCQGAGPFREKVTEAKGILTPDNEFFEGESLARLRDQAVEEHRTGRTEPWE